MVIASFFTNAVEKIISIESPDTDQPFMQNLRQVVGPCPWGGVFNIIVSRHMLGQNCDLIVGVLGQQVCRRQARDTSTESILAS